MRHFLGTRKRSGRPSFTGATLRVRLVSLFCLLLVALASTAQAVHVHGSGIGDRSAQVTRQQVGALAPDDSVCPLCVAMHSAMPVAPGHDVFSLREVVAENAPWHLAITQETEHFAGFSRPPPVAGVLLG